MRGRGGEGRGGDEREGRGGEVGEVMRGRGGEGRGGDEREGKGKWKKGEESKEEKHISLPVGCAMVANPDFLPQLSNHLCTPFLR